MITIELEDNEAALLFKEDQVDIALPAGDKDTVQTFLCVATAKHLRDEVLISPEHTKEFIDKLFKEAKE